MPEHESAQIIETIDAVVSKVGRLASFVASNAEAHVCSQNHIHVVGSVAHGGSQWVSKSLICFHKINNLSLL